MAVTVGIRELRNNLRSYLEHVKCGEDVLVTDRGRPIARLTPMPGKSKREELIARGLITPATKPFRPIVLDDLPEAAVPLSEEISRQRGPD